MKNLASIISLISVFTFSSQAASVRDGSLHGFSNGNEIVVRWQSEDEVGIRKIEIERQAGAEGMFILLNEIRLKGNNQQYEYIDDSAFRSAESLFKYRLKVTYGNGATEYYGPITVRHTVNNVRRTWGSIKAMFR